MNRIQQAAIFSAIMMATQPLHSASLGLSFTVLPTTVMQPEAVEEAQSGGSVSTQLTKTAQGTLSMLLNFTSNSPNGFFIDVSHAMAGGQEGADLSVPEATFVTMDEGEAVASTSFNKEGTSLAFKGAKSGQKLKVNVTPPVRPRGAGRDVITLMVTAR